jgi:hypothetical protein
MRFHAIFGCPLCCGHFAAERSTLSLLQRFSTPLISSDGPSLRAF